MVVAVHHQYVPMNSSWRDLYWFCFYELLEEKPGSAD
jgi:hypothetical protein